MILIDVVGDGIEQCSASISRCKLTNRSSAQVLIATEPWRVIFPDSKVFRIDQITLVFWNQPLSDSSDFVGSCDRRKECFRWRDVSGISAV